jgi:Tfp pilus assembly PilM family ATPase
MSAKNDEISSTERLLDLIRSKKPGEVHSSDIDPTKLSNFGLPAPSFSPFSFRKKITIGVDIGYNALKMVKISHSSDKKQEMLDYLRVPFESDISKDSPKFYPFLRNALHRFCGPTNKRIEIWSAISSARVETRYLRIPKVPKKQISKAVYWTYKKKVSFNDNDDFFDFEILGEIIEAGVQKIEVMAYAAPKKEILELKDIFAKSGYPVAGISIVPFAVQNLLRTRRLEIAEKNICSLFIGRDWSRIAIYSNGNLVLSRGIKAGVGSMVEAIKVSINGDRPLSSQALNDSERLARSRKNRKGPQINALQARKLFFNLVYGATPIADKNTGLEIREEHLFEMVLPALERLVRQVERTIEHYSLNFGNDAISKIFISGPLCANQRMLNHIGGQLDLPVGTLDPFASGSSFLSGIISPRSAIDKEAFVPAVGMALSSNYLTPNFIFTYKDKEKISRIANFNRTVFAAFLVIMALCMGFYLLEAHRIEQKKIQIANLHQQLESFSPQVDQNLIVRLAAQTKQKQQTLDKFGKKYIGMALLSEISNLTPSNIRLSSISADLTKSPGAAEKQDKKILILDGIVFGNHLTFEASLAGYLVRLKDSPIFFQPRVNRKSFEMFENKKVLRFTAQLELV